MLYGCETWSLTAMRKTKAQMEASENGALQRMLRPKSKNLTETGRKMHGVELGWVMKNM
jgi:hypothetical protein